MRVELFFISVIVVLVIAIIILAVGILTPPLPEKKLTFDDVIDLSAAQRSKVRSIKIIYGVNISSTDGVHEGEMIYTRYNGVPSYELSPEVAGYTGTALLLNPDEIGEFILFNNREEYSGVMEELFRPCWSTITEPVGNYSKFFGGNYIFVTCFDQVTGYPILVYGGEVAGEDVVYSKLFVKNITYDLL